MSHATAKPSSETGASKLEILIWLTILAAIVLAVFQIVPALYTRYEIGLALDRAVSQTNVNMPDEDIRALVATSLKILKLDREVRAQDVKISRKYDQVNLTYPYTVQFGIPQTPINHPVTFVVRRP